MSLTRTKIGIWILFAVPFVLICANYAADSISYGQVIHQSGLWSAGFLVAALVITPLRAIIGSAQWLLSIATYRRALGVASFAYAALHTWVYLERKWGADLIIREGFELPLATGWLAFAIFLVLAVTSNDASVRSLGTVWKKLHRYVYVATLLMFAHWILATIDPYIAYFLAFLILAIQVPRIVGARRKSKRR